MGISLAVLFLVFSTMAMELNKENEFKKEFTNITFVVLWLAGCVVSGIKIIDWISCHITLN